MGHHTMATGAAQVFPDRRKCTRLSLEAEEVRMEEMQGLEVSWEGRQILQKNGGQGFSSVHQLPWKGERYSVEELRRRYIMVLLGC